MKRIIKLLLLSCIILCGCSAKPIDHRNRPSTSGKLQVLNGKLSDKDGNPVMLRGISNAGVSTGKLYTRQDTFDYLSKELGVNVIRLALYTTGVGEFGYCTGTNSARDQMDDLVEQGIEYAKNSDMYVIIDWHILDDGDPYEHIEEAKQYFDKVSKKYKTYQNVLYEICNEPNGKDVDWQRIKSYAEQIIPIIRNNDPHSVIIVGTPNWSRDVDEAAKDPLEFDNVLYTLHFYAASHKQELRDKAQAAYDKGLPIFVSEYGITSSSGGFPVDEQEADTWIEFLEEKGMSYVLWNLSKTGEPCAILRKSCMSYTDFSDEDYTVSGLWLKKTLEAHQ